MDICTTTRVQDRVCPKFTLHSGSQAADNAIRGILTVLEQGKIGEIYNIGGLAVEENISMARRLLLLVGKDESLLRFVQDRPGHDRRYALNCKKMENELGWRPKISLEDGLRHTIEWYKENQKWLDNVRDGEYRVYYDRYYENRDISLQAIACLASRDFQ